ncbi:DUF317 domain-containing protein [Streptomyces ipomoeae]|uniref:DUF317 domain-containing protein n=1 Tax=Streptomyces ipomoeae TaxID=103232 RepID=UPI0011467E96|nr:DUF317 domain-containing protein [Streptomyces ipomoeae]TQE33158.1 DUF317 domain-containing protein [Streptomyces ipomoeae]
MTSTSTLLIAPRYLAGPDARHAAAIGEQLTLAGWLEARGDEGSRYTSADGRREALYGPDGACRGAYDTEPSWRFAARLAPGAPALWTAAFTPATPPELIAAFAAALADDAAHDAEGAPHYLRPPTAPLEAARALDGAGWIRDLGAEAAWYEPTTMQAVVVSGHRAPDGTVATNWLFAARRAVNLSVLWHALATPEIPGHLVDALCRALIDPAPAARTVLPHPSVGRLKVIQAA